MTSISAPSPAATMDPARVNRIIREGDEARKDCTTDAGKDYDDVIRPALLSLLQQTTREVTEDEISPLIAQWYSAWFKDDLDGQPMKLTMARKLRERFIILPRPVVSLVEW